MLKNEAKSKSKTARKPLRDVSNKKYNNGGTFSKPLDMKKGLRFSEKEEDRCKGVEEEEGEEDGSLDRLLLVQSDLSSLVHQVTTLSLSLLTICLFLEKMISNNKNCILLCVF